MSLVSAFRLLVRAVRAEAVRAGGPTGASVAGLVFAMGPPLLISLAVAALSTRIAKISAASHGALAVAISADTANAAYWVVSLAPVGFAVAAAFAAAAAPRGPAGPLERFLNPVPVFAALARWIYFGAFAAVCTGGLTAAVLAALPRLFPIVYGEVQLLSGPGARLVAVGAAVAFLLCGAAIGLAQIVAHPAAALVGVLAWTEIVEPGVALVPGGASAQRYMPFLNGIYASGQGLVFVPPWSPDVALLYCAAVCGAVFAVGTAVCVARRRFWG